MAAKLTSDMEDVLNALRTKGDGWYKKMDLGPYVRIQTLLALEKRGLVKGDYSDPMIRFDLALFVRWQLTELGKIYLRA